MSGHADGWQARARALTRSRAGLALLAAAAVVAGLLAYEHRIHVFSSTGLVIGLLLACGAMHLFMHGHHGGHGGGADQDK